MKSKTGMNKGIKKQVRKGKKPFLLYLDHDIRKQVEVLKECNVNITVYFNSILIKHFKIPREK